MSNMKKHPPGSPCKPCWELKCCPYGVFVEFFPLPGENGELADSDEIKKRHELALQQLHENSSNESQDVWGAIARVWSTDPNTWEYLRKFDANHLSCNVFGHICPIFIVAEHMGEFTKPRNQSRNIPRDVMLKVVRRDNGVCQICFNNVPDNEVEFDHIIPLARGGPTTESNLRLVHRTCNRKKGASIEGDDS